MKYLKLLILPLALLLSCHNNDEVIEPVIENQMKITIDGSEYESINESIEGNENCDRIFIQASYYDKNKIDFTIKFEISKEGNLLKVWYEEYILPLNTSQVKKIFLTPNFNPISTFSISNFIYNPTTGEVKFNFEGTVFYENDTAVTKKISGEIKVESLESVACSVAKTGLSYNSEELSLFSFYNDKIQYENQNQLHRFFSNNGYSVYLHLTKDLWDYPLGEIEFTEDDLVDRVDFFKAIGSIKADQIQSINNQQWKTYKTSGKIIIENKYTEGAEKVIKGKFILTIKDEGKLVYVLNGVEFKTGSFKK